MCSKLVATVLVVTFAPISCGPKSIRYGNRIPTMRHTFQFSPTIAINFEMVGRGSRPMVLLHGFGASLESWRDIQPLLEGDHQLYLLDLKGHGLSSKPRDANYSLEHQAEIVAGFIEHQQLRDVVLVGHSYGGAASLMTYFRLRDQVGKIGALILVDAAAYLQAPPFFVSSLQVPILNAIILNLTPARLRASYTLKRIFFNQAKVTPELIDRYVRFFNLPGAHYAFVEAAKQIVPPEADKFVRTLSTITAPTLIIWGANDPVISPSMATRLNQQIAGSQLAIVPDCGHVPQEEKPNETAAIMRSFMK